MQIQGSEAYNLYDQATPRRSRERQAAPRFEVVEGRGLDARVREGVSAKTLSVFKTVLLAIAVVFALSLVRVGVTAATVSTLKANAELKTAVSAAEDAGKALSVEASVLSNSARINTIATQNLGMVYQGAGETITVTVPNEA